MGKTLIINCFAQSKLYPKLTTQTDEMKYALK